MKGISSTSASNTAPLPADEAAARRQFLREQMHAFYGGARGGQGSRSFGVGRGRGGTVGSLSRDSKGSQERVVPVGRSGEGGIPTSQGGPSSSSTSGVSSRRQPPPPGGSPSLSSLTSFPIPTTTTTGVPANPIDSEYFSVQQYITQLLQNETLQGLVETDTKLLREVRRLDHELQELVYRNYSKFISATDTIREMHSHVSDMMQRLSSLHDHVGMVDVTSRQVFAALQPHQKRVEETITINRKLKKANFIQQLPRIMAELLKEESYAECVQHWVIGDAFFKKHIPRSFHALEGEKGERSMNFKALSLSIKSLTTGDNKSTTNSTESEHPHPDSPQHTGRKRNSPSPEAPQTSALVPSQKKEALVVSILSSIRQSCWKVGQKLYRELEDKIAAMPLEDSAAIDAIHALIEHLRLLRTTSLFVLSPSSSSSSSSPSSPPSVHWNPSVSASRDSIPSLRSTEATSMRKDLLSPSGPMHISGGQKPRQLAPSLTLRMVHTGEEDPLSKGDRCTSVPHHTTSTAVGTATPNHTALVSPDVTNREDEEEKERGERHSERRRRSSAGEEEEEVRFEESIRRVLMRSVHSNFSRDLSTVQLSIRDAFLLHVPPKLFSQHEMGGSARQAIILPPSDVKVTGSGAHPCSPPPGSSTGLFFSFYRCSPPSAAMPYAWIPALQEVLSSLPLPQRYLPLEKLALREPLARLKTACALLATNSARIHALLRHEGGEREEVCAGGGTSIAVSFTSAHKPQKTEQENASAHIAQHVQPVLIGILEDLRFCFLSYIFTYFHCLFIHLPPPSLPAVGAEEQGKPPRSTATNERDDLSSKVTSRGNSGLPGELSKRSESTLDKKKSSALLDSENNASSRIHASAPTSSASLSFFSSNPPAAGFSNLKVGRSGKGGKIHGIAGVDDEDLALDLAASDGEVEEAEGRIKEKEEEENTLSFLYLLHYPGHVKEMIFSFVAALFRHLRLMSVTLKELGNTYLNTPLRQYQSKGYALLVDQTIQEIITSCGTILQAKIQDWKPPALSSSRNALVQEMEKMGGNDAVDLREGLVCACCAEMPTLYYSSSSFPTLLAAVSPSELPPLPLSSAGSSSGTKHREAGQEDASGEKKHHSPTEKDGDDDCKDAGGGGHLADASKTDREVELHSSSSPASQPFPSLTEMFPDIRTRHTVVALSTASSFFHFIVMHLACASLVSTIRQQLPHVVVRTERTTSSPSSSLSHPSASDWGEPDDPGTPSASSMMSSLMVPPSSSSSTPPLAFLPSPFLVMDGAMLRKVISGLQRSLAAVTHHAILLEGQFSAARLGAALFHRTQPENVYHHHHSSRKDKEEEKVEDCYCSGDGHDGRVNNEVSSFSSRNVSPAVSHAASVKQHGNPTSSSSFSTLEMLVRRDYLLHLYLQKMRTRSESSSLTCPPGSGDEGIDVKEEKSTQGSDLDRICRTNAGRWIHPQFFNIVVMEWTTLFRFVTHLPKLCFFADSMGGPPLPSFTSHSSPPHGAPSSPVVEDPRRLGGDGGCSFPMEKSNLGLPRPPTRISTSPQSSYGISAGNFSSSSTSGIGAVSAAHLPPPSSSSSSSSPPIPQKSRSRRQKRVVAVSYLRQETSSLQHHIDAIFLQQTTLLDTSPANGDPSTILRSVVLYVLRSLVDQVRTIPRPPRDATTKRISSGCARFTSCTYLSFPLIHLHCTFLLTMLLQPPSIAGKQRDGLLRHYRKFHLVGSQGSSSSASNGTGDAFSSLPATVPLSTKDWAGTGGVNGWGDATTKLFQREVDELCISAYDRCCKDSEEAPCKSVELEHFIDTSLEAFAMEMQSVYQR